MTTQDETHGRLTDEDLVRGRAYAIDPETGEKASLDGVSYAYATEEDLALYDEANRQLAQVETPILAGQNDPNKYVFFAVFDGTGNDRHNPSEAPTGVAQIYAQIDDQIDAGWGDGRVAAAYITGAATREYGDDRYDIIDGALGYTSDDRAETMYVEFCKQAAAWRDKDPNAEISIASMGFSRGAEEVALFTRLVEERGIVHPDSLQYETRDGGLVAAGSVTISEKPHRLVEPGQVPQAAALVDPVPEGQLENRDRRLAPSVISAVQLTARDETRDQFIGSQHLPLGLSDDNKSLNVVVPGAHADVGDGYYANGLGVRNTNFVKNYLNNLVDFDTPMLTLKPEDSRVKEGSTNVIHDSAEHRAVYSNELYRQDGVRDVHAELNTPEPPVAMGRAGYGPPVIPEADTRREAMDPTVASGLEYRKATIAAAPVASSDTNFGIFYDAKEEQQTGCALVPPAIEVASPSNYPSSSAYNITSTIFDAACETGAFPVEKIEPAPPLEPELVKIKTPSGYTWDAPPMKGETGIEVVGTLPMNTETHPAFPMYGEAWNAMADPAKTNIPWGNMSENDRARAAAAVTAAAMTGPPPLDRVDSVFLNKSGDTLIAIEGNPTDPASKRVSVPLETAVKTPVEESTKKADAALEDQQQKALAIQNNMLQPSVAPTTRAQ